MDNKVSSILEKALQEKRKGNHHKALERLNEALQKFPDQVELYLEAADVCLEAGESLKATQFLKKAEGRFAGERERIDSFGRERMRTLKDPILGKFLLDQAIKHRDLSRASDMLDDLQERNVRELLQRTRQKKQTVASATNSGHTLTGEAVVVAVGEGLLYLRLGRMKEALRAFLDILEEKPVENDVLEPFFAGMEKKHPNAARVRYAYACSLMVSEQYEKAVSRFVQAVKLDAKLSDECLQQLRDLSGKFESPPEYLQDALVEILLVKGEVQRATELLRELLAKNPDKAKHILELTQPFVENIGECAVIHFVYVDAALHAEQPLRALDMLRKLCREESRRPEVLQWLEGKSANRFLPTDIMLFHAELALQAGNTDRGVEILEAVANNSPNDVPTILTVVEKHKERDPRLVKLLEKYAKETPVTGASDDGSGFEHFENKEFRFSTGFSGSSPSSPGGGERPADGGVRPSAGRESISEKTAAAASKQPPAALEEGLLLAAEDVAAGRGGPVRDGENSAAEPAEKQTPSAASGSESSEDTSWLETQGEKVMSIADHGDTEPLGKTGPEEKMAADTTAAAYDEEPERKPLPPDGLTFDMDAAGAKRAAEVLREAGARIFFHVENEEQSAAVAEPPPVESSREPGSQGRKPEAAGDQIPAPPSRPEPQAAAPAPGRPPAETDPAVEDRLERSGVTGSSTDDIEACQERKGLSKGAPPASPEPPDQSRPSRAGDADKLKRNDHRRDREAQPPVLEKTTSLQDD